MNELKLWNYLVKKCKKLNDNNYTARLIYNYINRLNNEARIW